MRKYALRVRQQAAESPLWADFFDATAALVPVPRSTPYVAAGKWPAENLAVALLSEGLGSTVWPGLHRIRAVRRSSTSAPGARPTVHLHYESLYIERLKSPPERIVLIDDVVTRGRTLLAAASCIHDALPCAEIRAFALVRTMGFITGVQRLLDPCRGEIRWISGDARRTP